MRKFSIQYFHPMGEAITNGELYLCKLDRYSYSGSNVEVGFTEHLEDSGFFSTLSLDVVLRYLNMKFKDGVPENLINRERKDEIW